MLTLGTWENNSDHRADTFRITLSIISWKRQNRFNAELGNLYEVPTRNGFKRRLEY